MYLVKFFIAFVNFELKSMNANFLLPMISCNELSIALFTEHYLLILWCCIRSSATQCTLYMVLYLWRTCQCYSYKRCSDRTSVFWCYSSLKNLAVPDDLYSSLSVPVELSYWPCMRWCGTGGFQEQGQCFFIGLCFSIPFCLLLFFPFYSFCL